MLRVQLIRLDPGYPASGEALSDALALVGAGGHMVNLGRDHPLRWVGRGLV
jgi:hypothetical protein